MAPSVRRKAAPAPAKPAKKRRASDSSTPADLSDEYGYSGVEDISDSEDDDEEDVNAVEEENILTETGPSPRPVKLQQIDSDDDELDENDDDVQDDGDDGDESTSWAGIVSEGSQASDFLQEESQFASDAAVERHVRFDVPSSDSESTETEDDHADIFPDIFIDQHSLDPAFRREIEDDDDDSSGSGSYWDYRGHYEQLESDDTPYSTAGAASHARANHAMTDADFPSPIMEEAGGLDGYETDGETTEEDVPEPIIRKKTRRPSLSSRTSQASHLSDSDESAAEDTPKPQRGQPRTRRVNLDRSDRKPIAVLNPVTRKMMIFTPHRRRQLDLSPEQFNMSLALPQESSPLLTQSANMMLSAMMAPDAFGEFGDYMTQTIGPEEAFFPHTPNMRMGEIEASSPSGEDADEDEQALDISDFILWDSDGMSSNDEDEGREWEPSSTPMRPTTASSEAGVLSHLKPENVGAFRQNQINQQLILSNQATQDSLTFSGPYNLTTIKGLKSDRFETAATPLTPVRRQKRQMRDLARSPLESVSAKRKASSEVDSNHKRQRSISDVNNLHI